MKNNKKTFRLEIQKVNVKEYQLNNRKTIELNLNLIGDIEDFRLALKNVVEKPIISNGFYKESIFSEGFERRYVEKYSNDSLINSSIVILARLVSETTINFFTTNGFINSTFEGTYHQIEHISDLLMRIQVANVIIQISKNEFVELENNLFEYIHHLNELEY